MAKQKHKTLYLKKHDSNAFVPRGHPPNFGVPFLHVLLRSSSDCVTPENVAQISPFYSVLASRIPLGPTDHWIPGFLSECTFL